MGKNPWTFGIVFLCFCAFLMWNNFDILPLPLGQKETTIGKVIEIKIGQGVKYRYAQIVKYVYSVNGKDYLGRKSLGLKHPHQNVGNRIKIEYSVRKPEKSDAIGFYKDFYNQWEKISFHSVKENGYYNIELVNDIFHYTDYADGGKVLSSFKGKLQEVNDTMTVYPFKYEKRNEELENLRYRVFRDSLTYKRLILIDLETKRIFK